MSHVFLPFLIPGNIVLDVRDYTFFFASYAIVLSVYKYPYVLFWDTLIWKPFDFFKSSFEVPLCSIRAVSSLDVIILCY